jgi:non-ribosomal peptide synthetase component E (peptide arylation enzyme)
MISNLTPLEFLARSGSVYRDCVAVVDEERRVSYAELQFRVRRLASALAREASIQGIGLLYSLAIAWRRSNATSAYRWPARCW